ncbi:MAG: hypothetical protein HY736_18605 [Verrucomicrobia bacterium]|nr:hypothetical protein [Verrucomicrobiota bacterium]
MKLTTLLLVVSVGANLVLGWVLCRPVKSDRRASNTSTVAANDADSGAKEARSIRPGVVGLPSSIRPGTPAETRDRLRGLGFSEEFVRAAVRAQVEAPRLARQRAMAVGAASQSWWQVASSTPAGTAEQHRELRQSRLAERTELTRLLGLIGSVTTEEIEPYAFLPEGKAARVAAIRRDFLELRDEIPADGAGPSSRAEAQKRQKLLYAEWDREVAALLTPAEFDEYKLRTSVSASAVGHGAKYFPGTADEFRALYEADKTWRAATDAEESFNEARRQAMEKMRQDTLAALGPERYAEWKRASQSEYQAMVELQRRFPQPAATLAALEAVPRQISEEAMVVAREQKLPDEQKLAKLRAIAADGRARVRAILGPDLGDAYNEASARGWLAELERGMVPMYQPNGERAVFMAVRPGQLAPRRANPAPASVPPKR